VSFALNTLGSTRGEDVDGPHRLQHDERDVPARRASVGDAGRIRVRHVRPNLVSFSAFRLTPGGLAGLGRDLHADGLAGHDVQIPLGVLVGSALRSDDHDLAADIAVDERLDVDVPDLRPAYLIRQ